MVASAAAAPAGPARARMHRRPARRRRCRSTTTSIAPGAASASRSTAAASRSRTATARQGLYFVRYVDPKFAGREEPNFFSRLLSFGRKKNDDGRPAKYRVKVTGEGTTSSVAVLDSTGKPENSDNGKRIASLLLEDLK